MRALLTQIGGDLRRRRVQTLVIIIIVGLSAGVGTVAAQVLTEATSPYTTAFSQYHGAHLEEFFRGNVVTREQLLATSRLPEVAASAGPWSEHDLALAFGTQKTIVAVIARSDQFGPVDRLPITAGRWISGSGEIVLNHSFAEAIGASVGSQVKLLGDTGVVQLLVVGEVVDIDECSASNCSPQAAWVEPQQFAALIKPGFHPTQMMVYRFRHAATDADLQQRSQEIAAILPPDAVSGSLTYLAVERIFNLDSDLTLTFLLAFAVFALGAAALIVANVVSGAVLSSRRDIGVLKALGFTPNQVVVTFVGQMLVAALVGCLLGIPLGLLAARPLVNAGGDALGLPAPSAGSPVILLLVAACALLVVAVAATVPALRAGLLSPVEAITPNAPMGAARPSWIAALARGLHLPRPVTLGAGDAYARPVRGLLTTMAITIGVATLVFAFGLHSTFTAITSTRAFGTIADVTIARFGSYPDASLMSTLQSNPDTRQVIATDFTQLSVPGSSNPVTTIAVRGDSAALGYPLEAGRWFSGPGEVVGGTAFVSQAHLHIGESFDAMLAGHPVHLRLVGIYFTFDNFGQEAQVDWSTYLAADPTAEPSGYLVDLRPGADIHAFAARVQGTAPDFLSVTPSTTGPASRHD